MLSRLFNQTGSCMEKWPSYVAGPWIGLRWLHSFLAKGATSGTHIEQSAGGGWL